jgi:hypothetical protein
MIILINERIEIDLLSRLASHNNLEKLHNLQSKNLNRLCKFSRVKIPTILGPLLPLLR